MRLEGSSKNLLKWFHKYHGNEEKTRVNIEKDGSRVVFQSKDGVLARAQLTHTSQGKDLCKEILTVDITGAEQSSAKGEQGGDTGTASVTFVLLIAGLCAVTLVGLILLLWRVKVLGRKQRLQATEDLDPHDNSFEQRKTANSTKSLSDKINVVEQTNNVKRVNRFSCTKVLRSSANQAGFGKTRSFSCPPKLEGLSVGGLQIKTRRGIMKPSKENKDYLQDGSGDEVVKMNPDKVLSDLEDSDADEEVIHISSRPRTVSFSDEVS